MQEELYTALFMLSKYSKPYREGAGTVFSLTWHFCMKIRLFRPAAYEENETFDYYDQIDREPGYDVLRKSRGKPDYITYSIEL